jgi:hypothetical protein
LIVVISSQLLEPFYTRPGDVVANTLFGLVLYLLADKSGSPQGWHALALFLLTALVLGLLALILGAGRREGAGVRIGRSARILSEVASARVIYSTIFWLAVLGEFQPSDQRFWTLAMTWAALLILSAVNWERALRIRGAPEEARVEAMLGPSQLAVSGRAIPSPGGAVSLQGKRAAAQGFVITRIPYPDGVWASIHIENADRAEELFREHVVTVSTNEGPLPAFIGSVDKGSSDRELRFTATKPLEVGSTVVADDGNSRILHQIARVALDETRISGGSFLTEQVLAKQIGIFDSKKLTLKRHRWVPTPGASVLTDIEEEIDERRVHADWLLIGHVVGTRIPVYASLDALSEGHVAILGMTKMGKTTLACRLAKSLSASRRVVILDQTGEYRAKRGAPGFPGAAGWDTPGVAVKEPPRGTIGPDYALEFIMATAQTAASEYETGDPTARTILVDEAHQFIPEPAGLAFNAPGRESAVNLGIQIMQLRKFGISMMLVSQRTAVVAKSALSQCENVIAFKSVDQTGLDYLEQVGGEGIREILSNLQQGEAVVIGPAMSSEAPVAITAIQEFVSLAPETPR